ncbi:MAG: hypothetical protein HKN24_04490 [Acidimicrobiales bacterium]|nr:hypothetical protein [Acidimicrobiales bacterium]
MTGRPGALRNAVVLSALLLVGACGASSQEVNSADDGGPEGFFDITVGTADGGQLEWTSLEGRDVVLWFWAPW